MTEQERPASRDRLGVPVPAGETLARLFATFSPVWEIDIAGPDDRIGAPYHRAGGTVGVDASRPTEYRLASHAIVDGAVRLMSARAERAGVELIAETPPSTPHVRVDRRALRRRTFLLRAEN